MRIQRVLIFVILLALALIGCDQSPFRPDEQWSNITVSLSGTALSDPEVTVQTDVEGTYTPTPPLVPGDLPWTYHQFSFLEDYSIQLHCDPVLAFSGQTTAASTSFNTGTQTIYRITDSSASFTTDVVRHDIIVNVDNGKSTKVFSVIDNSNLYVFGDEDDTNIFGPSGENYEIYSSHELWLQVIVTDSENNTTDTTYFLQDSTIDLEVTE
jgi:Cu/Ag efflux protein CusF